MSRTKTCPESFEAVCQTMQTTEVSLKNLSNNKGVQLAAQRGVALLKHIVCLRPCALFTAVLITTHWLCKHPRLWGLRFSSGVIAAFVFISPQHAVTLGEECQVNYTETKELPVCMSNQSRRAETDLVLDP